MSVAAERFPLSRCAIDLRDYDAPDCLIYGIGNVGRQDDGLGWAFIDWLENNHLCTRGERLRHYQLHLEDADLIHRKRRVLFVDATKAADVPDFQLEEVHPRMDFSFTSHAISVPAILATARQCFGQAPTTHLLTIRGYAWALQLGLTPGAKRNLEAATAYLASLSFQNHSSGVRSR